MQERTAKRLHDALTAAQYIQQFVDGRTFQDFLSDVYFRSAVERQFEILSESLKAAASRDPKLHERFPELHAIVGLRNRIAHSYDELEEKTLWDAAIVELPTLVPRLATALDEFGLPDE
jgi:uncharacterized protein with HEPN domain